ncbi:MAG: HIRAN domain-containing protein [Mycobacteriaceae bacterium]
MSSIVLLDKKTVGAAGSEYVSRLLVTQRDPRTKQYRAVGFLDRLLEGYRFSYLQSAVVDPNFFPLGGFSDPQRLYYRERLFPAFSERVISAKRPDRPQYLESLSLELDAEPWEILGRSGGYRQGDPIELIPLPQEEPDTSVVRSVLLVHGVRHRSQDAQKRIDTLEKGEELLLLPELENPMNRDAIQVYSADGQHHLGYIPDPLVDFVQALQESSCAAKVIKANTAEVGPHLRLLVELTGKYRGGSPFDGPAWRTAA